MIVQNGHSFFGNEPLKEPKSFLAHLRENIETSSLYTSTPTTPTNHPKVVAPINADDELVTLVHEAEKSSRIFGDKKVATFYLHMSIAISTFIVLIFLGISAYYCYKRREFQNMDHTQQPLQQHSSRRRSSNGARRKGSQFSGGSEKTPMNLR